MTEFQLDNVRQTAEVSDHGTKVTIRSYDLFSRPAGSSYVVTVLTDSDIERIFKEMKADIVAHRLSEQARGKD